MALGRSGNRSQYSDIAQVWLLTIFARPYFISNPDGQKETSHDAVSGPGRLAIIHGYILGNRNWRTG